MTFTYVGTLLTDLDIIRFNIQDTVSGSGPRPKIGSNNNFTDEEIAGILTIEGNSNRATARMFEILSAAWSTHTNTRIEERSESKGDIAKMYMQRAKEWRANYGYGGTTVESAGVTRVDGYSDDIDSLTVT